MESDIELVINSVLMNVTLDRPTGHELVIDLMFTTKRRGQATSTPTSRFRLRTDRALELQAQLAQALDNLQRGGFPANPPAKH